jgi:hypothetical protein
MKWMLPTKIAGIFKNREKIRQFANSPIRQFANGGVETRCSRPGWNVGMLELLDDVRGLFLRPDAVCCFLKLSYAVRS